MHHFYYKLGLALFLSVSAFAAPPAALLERPDAVAAAAVDPTGPTQYICMPAYEHLSPRHAQALEVERQQRAYVDRVVEQIAKRSDQVAADIARANDLGVPYIVDVAGVGGGPQNAVGFANLRNEMPDGVFLLFESDDRMGTFHKMFFDVNTKELPLASGNVFPGVPVQPRDLNPHGVKYVPSTNFADVTALAHYYSQVDVAFRHKQLGVEVEPAPGAWPAPYKFKVEQTDKHGNKKIVYVYARGQLAAPGFGEPEARLNDPASQKLVSEEEIETQKAMSDPSRRNHYAPGIQSVDSFLRIAKDDVVAGRNAMARYGDDDFVVVGPRDGGAIGIEALTGLNGPLNPSGQPTLNPIVWLGQKATNRQQYMDAIPNQARVDRYMRIGDKLENKQVVGRGGYLQTVERVMEYGRKRFKLTYSERVDGSGAQGTMTTSHLVLATGYRGGVMKLFDGLGEEPSLTPVVVNPKEFTDNPGFGINTPIAGQVTTNNPDWTERKHPLYVIGNAILNALGGGEISQTESSAAVGGFIDILAPRSAAAGHQLGLALKNSAATNSVNSSVDIAASMAGETANIGAGSGGQSTARGLGVTPSNTIRGPKPKRERPGVKFIEAVSTGLVSSGNTSLDLLATGAGQIETTLKSRKPLKRLELAPANHPANYFDRQYFVSAKNETAHPLLFDNRIAAELEAKIQFARLLSAFRLPEGNDPIEFAVTRDDGRIQLRVFGLSSQSSAEVSEAVEKNAHLVQLMDNLFTLGGKSLNVTVPIRETGTTEAENMVFRVD